MSWKISMVGSPKAHSISAGLDYLGVVPELEG
jgi:tryptophan synthase beta subunit